MDRNKRMPVCTSDIKFLFNRLQMSYVMKSAVKNFDHSHLNK